MARAISAASYPEPTLEVAPPEPSRGAPSCSTSPPPSSRAVRAHHVGFPLRVAVRRHRRWIQVVGPRLVPGPESEAFYSCAVESSWGRYGALLPRLSTGAGGAVEEVALAVVALFRARQAPPPAPSGVPPCWRPPAVAVLLHEAVAHALEADTLVQGGTPNRRWASPWPLPASTCWTIRRRRRKRSAGPPTTRGRPSSAAGCCAAEWSSSRWRTRSGLAPRRCCSPARAGGGPAICRRGRARPTSRSCPAQASESDLLAGTQEGLYLPEASRGALDPLSGEFALYLPYARRFRRGALAETVGPCVLRGRVADLLTRVVAVGAEAKPAGAGWCAKGGQKLPVWATAPALRLEDVEVTP